MGMVELVESGKIWRGLVRIWWGRAAHPSRLYQILPSLVTLHLTVSENLPPTWGPRETHGTTPAKTIWGAPRTVGHKNSAQGFPAMPETITASKVH